MVKIQLENKLPYSKNAAVTQYKVLIGTLNSAYFLGFSIVYL
jgi:hypothetical protein